MNDNTHNPRNNNHEFQPEIDPRQRPAIEGFPFSQTTQQQQQQHTSPYSIDPNLAIHRSSYPPSWGSSPAISHASMQSSNHNNNNNFVQPQGEGSNQNWFSGGQFGNGIGGGGIGDGLYPDLSDQVMTYNQHTHRQSLTQQSESIGDHSRHPSISISQTLSPPPSEGSGSKADKPKAKKKRKTGTGEAEMDAEDKEKEKRTKTGRACDACRSKKIRCDILPTTTTPGGREAPQICARCKQYQVECTFFLPITETRFKKRKAADDNAASGSRADSPAYAPKEVPTRTEGPTSLSFLLHTTLPANATDAFDLKEHNKWEVSADGDGLIRVTAPPLNSKAESSDPTRGHDKLVKPTLNAETISSLVNAYFDHLAPLFPIVDRADFASKTTPNPLLLYAICGLGSTRREFPRELFAGVRNMINGLIRSNDILSDARFENVQALLLLSQVGDLHAQPTAATASASLLRLASAIRMAQDLGLHRESTLRAQTAQDLAFVELRRRVWATCVILDRWFGAALGVPLMIDLTDCDVLLPAPYDIIPDTDPARWPVNPSFMYLAEHLKLAILIGRVLKAIYSPTGLKHATDSQLQTLVTDMDTWHENLPSQIKFNGNTSPSTAGLLQMSFAAIQFLFWRVFFRITYQLPPHLEFRLQSHFWTKMLDKATDAIKWLNVNDSALDSLFIFAYTATSCALIQYHTWVRRGDQQALDMLRVIKETAIKWEQAVTPDQMSIRRKTCETMTLLHEAALKTNPDNLEDKPVPVNLTAGVVPRQNIGKSVWIDDETREGAGFWVVKTAEERHIAGIHPSHIKLLCELDPDSAAGKKALAALYPSTASSPANSTARSTPQTVNMSIISSSSKPDRIQMPPGPVQPSIMTQLPGNQQQQQAAQQQSQQSSQRQPMPMDFLRMQSSSNLNPEIEPGNNANESRGLSAGAGFPMFDLLNAGFTPYGNSQETNPFEQNMAGSMPTSGFDFPSWEQYFQTINLAAPPPEDDAFKY